MTPGFQAVPPSIWLTVTTSLAVLGIAAVHLGAGALEGLDASAHRRLVSVAGGVSVAYVFVHVLPAIERARVTIERQASALAIVEEHVYLIVLLGFLSFYGLERYMTHAQTEANTPEARGDATCESRESFWVHVYTFAGYNAVFGYLLVHRETPGIGGLVLFAGTTALHLLVVDFGLRRHHEQLYHRIGRWVLAGAVVVGAIAGGLSVVSVAVLEAMFAFLAGAIVLNALKEELPAERTGTFWAFAAGATVYSGLLVAT